MTWRSVRDRRLVSRVALGSQEQTQFCVLHKKDDRSKTQPRVRQRLPMDVHLSLGHDEALLLQSTCCTTRSEVFRAVELACVFGAW